MFVCRCCLGCNSVALCLFVSCPSLRTCVFWRHSSLNYLLFGVSVDGRQGWPCRFYSLSSCMDTSQTSLGFRCQLRSWVVWVGHRCPPPPSGSTHAPQSPWEWRWWDQRHKMPSPAWTSDWKLYLWHCGSLKSVVFTKNTQIVVYQKLYMFKHSDLIYRTKIWPRCWSIYIIYYSSIV